MENKLSKRWFIAFNCFLGVAFLVLLANLSHIDKRNQLAQIATNKANFNVNKLPILRQGANEPVLSAEAFFSIFVGDNNEKILIERNKEKQLPIASITKLMVAVVASEHYKASDTVVASKNALKERGLSGIYQAGDQFLFSDALYALLLASHNEIAFVMAEQIGVKQFIDEMNQKAQEIELLNTIFTNVTGLDPIMGEEINSSTVFDVYKMARYVEENYPDIFLITAQKEFNLFDTNRKFIAKLSNTDELLGQQGAVFRVIGGKTGETPRAKQNLVIVSQAPCNGKIFSVVLGSQDRFGDMQKILEYVRDSYKWGCSP